MKNNILVIGDLHFPFEAKGALQFCKKIRKEFNCGRVIQLGDITDSYGFSKYNKDPDAFTIRDEVIQVRRKVHQWAEVFPVMDVMLGNHDMRMQKRLFEAGIPVDMIAKTLSEIYGIPAGWKWHGHIENKGVMYFHGTTAGDYAHVNASKNYRCSIVQGHSHTAAGVHWTNNPLRQTFGANAGCLIDVNKYAFTYAKDMVRQPVLGCVVMMNEVHPIFIPYGSI